VDLFGFNSPDDEVSKPQTLCEFDRQQAVELLKRRGELQNFEVQMRNEMARCFGTLLLVRMQPMDTWKVDMLKQKPLYKPQSYGLYWRQFPIRCLYLTAEGQVIEAVEEPNSYINQSRSRLETLHQIF